MSTYAFKPITNQPIIRSSFIHPWAYWDNAFTDEELEKIVRYFAEQGVERATTVGQKLDENNIPVAQPENNEDVRISNVRFYRYEESNELTSMIFHKLNYVIEQINGRFYNFDLNGYESFQYTEYESFEQGRYDFHMDTIMDVASQDIEMRKLSLTLLLNDPEKDFDGGDFYINRGQEDKADKVDLKRGRIILFPSFMIHRVAPVTRGKRKSLVVWVLGPKFR